MPPLRGFAPEPPSSPTLSDEEPPDEAPVEIPITDEIDLHSFAPADVRSVVEEYLLACRERGLLEVRVVHGRGRGVQRASIRQLLASLEGVEWFDDAPPQSGGWGATLVRLRPLEKKPRA